MSEHNKMLVSRGIEEIWNRGNFDLIEEFVASDYAGHSSMAETSGPQEAAQFFASLRAAFSGLHFTIEDQFAEDDKVATRWRARGTFTGEFQGIPPTGKQGDITGITISRIANGRAVEGWTSLDELGLMRQLGVIPSPEAVGQ
jgi:steroid delta-isomerase-like uncharacterized protein